MVNERWMPGLVPLIDHRSLTIGHLSILVVR
jgi:hypothetical protein